MIPDLVLNLKCFNLKYTLECGQCFRWGKIDENKDIYIGVIKDRVIKIMQEGNTVSVWSNKKDNLEKVIIEYFDLSRDYEKIEKKISKIDKNIEKSVNYSSGIHILNQPVFETIISYIISANNNIKRISRSVNEISKKYGEEVEFENKKYYLFPTLENLKKITIDELLKCGVGFRARYIKHDLERFANEPDFLKELEKLDTNEACIKLCSLMGVGQKVADCILLFSLSRGEVFPVDVWVKRVMEKLYFKENTSMKKIREYANNNFKEYAGIVQQHLFHNVREGNL